MSVNQSEARLGNLSRSTFLSMWSYQNPYYAPGKELCDVLVIFGDDVIVMSDKFNEFGDHIDPTVNWQRWYRKAVFGSVRQLLGARRRLSFAPDKVFSDSLASSPFPLQLPPKDRMRLHLVAVANGIEEVSTKTLGFSGLRLDTRCKDECHPMTVGVFFEETFVHVLSGTALEAIFLSLDTARDLIDYLVRKEAALSNGHWLIRGEQNLLAAYISNRIGDYSIPIDSFPLEEKTRVVHSEIWSTYINSEEMRSREERRKVSFVVDSLIEHIAEEFANCRLVIGQDQPLTYHEEAFRLLARESRPSRQLIGRALHDIWDETTKTFWANAIWSPEFPGVLYLWLLYPEPPADYSTEQVEGLILDHPTSPRN